MEYSPIISTSDLARHMNNKTRVMDCRFNLTNPAWGFENYQLGHIPGALYADLNQDLSGPVGPETGRHPFPEVKVFLQTLAGWGISPESDVVVYDTVGGALASRLWFMLRAIGHEQVRVLDGGFPKWHTDGYPINQGVEKNTPAEVSPKYASQFNSRMLAYTSQVEAELNDPTTLVIDARAPERFQGIQEPIDPVAGHIPGASNRFHGNNLTPEGIFKSREVLRDEFLQLLGNHPADRTIVYCGSGVTSCHHLVALEQAGLAGARLYAGSWSEWIRDSARPVATSQE